MFAQSKFQLFGHKFWAKRCGLSAAHLFAACAIQCTVPTTASATVFDLARMPGTKVIVADQLSSRSQAEFPLPPVGGRHAPEHAGLGRELHQSDKEHLQLRGTPQMLVDRPAQGGDIVVKSPSKISRLERTFQILNVVDFAQTASCLHAQTCREGNPLLGSRPSIAKLAAVKAISIFVHSEVTNYLSRERPDLVDFWQYGTIAIQGGVVAWNARLMF